MEKQAAKQKPGTNRAELLAQARETASSPGVYLMKDEGGHVLYVGKAKALKSRLQTYFQAGPHPSPRTEMMVGLISRFDVILTETEAEALILEATLVKKHKPKFNVRLKDDKAYPYLKIAANEDFPRIEWTRRVLRDGARYFGPFPSAWSARQVMRLLNESFQLRDCSDNAFRHRSRPCILHQIGRCSGSCVGVVDQKQYSESVGAAIRVLEGKTDTLIAELRRGMEDASEREEFEAAAGYRDQIKNLELITQTQAVVEAGNARDRDVVGLARRDADAHGTVLMIRGGKLVAVKHYHLQNTDTSLPESEVLFDFLSQYYLAGAGKRVEEPAGMHELDEPTTSAAQATEVLLPAAPEEPDLLERAIGLGVRVADGAVDEQLLNVARSNAEYALEQSSRRAQGHGVRALEEVQEKLHLAKLPQRIECYDISNTQGSESVASRVVFIDGAPDKNLYRRYKIRTVEGSNDFASMREVLGRRFAPKNIGEKAEVIEALPDLVVVDGGKGQLAQAVTILEELNIQGIDVVGLAKARTERDFRSMEVKSSQERIFIPGRKNPVPLYPSTDAYKLLVHVRDEAHRFAVSYHRLLRSKRTFKSTD